MNNKQAASKSPRLSPHPDPVTGDFSQRPGDLATTEVLIDGWVGSWIKIASVRIDDGFPIQYLPENERMSTEKGSCLKGTWSSNQHFEGAMLVFGGVSVAGTGKI